MASNVKPPVGATLNRDHPLANDLVACWLFNEGSGNVIHECCNNVDNLFVDLSNPSTSSSGWRRGPSGSVVRFNGSSNYMQGVPVGLPQGNVSLTMICRVRFTNAQAPGVPAILAYGSEGGRQMWGFGMRPQGFYFLGYSNDANQDWSYNTNQWYWLALSTSGTSVKWYADGLKIGPDGTISIEQVTKTFVAMGIQRPGNKIYYDGDISDIFLYKKELPQSMIQNVMGDPYSMFEEGSSIWFPEGTGPVPPGSDYFSPYYRTLLVGN